jgi:signal transduction histidine kinase
VVPNVLSFRSPSALAEEVAARTKELRQSEKALKSLNEMLREKNEEMEQFVYTVSHDLKSPLITSSGFLTELRDDLQRGDMAAAQDSIMRIGRANDRMSQLIHDLLELSSLGRVQIQPEWLDTEEVVADVVAGLEKQAKQAAVKVSVAPNLSRLYADMNRFVQVLENLLTNAFKYACDEPHRVIEVGVDTDHEQARLYVRDQGPGVLQSDSERIFGLFERGTAKRPGTGVGLAIVARIAKTHGGKAWVESAAEGATFWVSFPVPDSSSPIR